VKNRKINISVVEEVAIVLGELKNHMVFVGGAVVSLYANDPVADEIRPTSDIDLTVNLLNFKSWSDLQNDLAQLNIFPDPFGHSIYSYKYKDIPIDIIPASNSLIAATNSWYVHGFDSLWKIKANKTEINILSSACYLATKFEAFNNRGKDYRSSHDFEDIIYILDNRINIVEEINQSKHIIKDFLKLELEIAYSSDMWEDILLSHIHPFIFSERESIITNKVKKIINL
jgi:predicted nucleotidyltransferase